MMRRILAGVLLACGACRAPAAPAPLWNHDARSGLAVRAVARGRLVMGSPLRVVLEAWNRGDRTVCFDAQGLGHSPFRLDKPDGSPALFIDHSLGGMGTMQYIVILPPGHSCELAVLDLSDHFALFEPGDYTFHFLGLGPWGFGLEKDAVPDEAPPGSIVAGVPESPPLRIRITGSPGPRDRLIERLLPTLPEGWILHQGYCRNEITFLRSELPGSHLRASFSLYWGPGLPADVPPDSVRRIGTCSSGNVWLEPVSLYGKARRQPSDDALEADLRKTLIPEMERKIVGALEIR